METSFLNFSKRKSMGRKHPREVENYRNSSAYNKHFILSKYWQHPIQGNHCLERAGHQRPSLYPSVNTNKTSGTPHPSDLKVNHISIYISCKYSNQSRGNQEGTHCLSHRFRCLFSDLLLKGLPPSTVWSGLLHYNAGVYITDNKPALIWVMA